MLAAVKDASRRLRRWPAAILDRGSARRSNGPRPGRGNAAQPNKETSRRSRNHNFADVDGHNYCEPGMQHEAERGQTGDAPQHFPTVSLRFDVNRL